MGVVLFLEQVANGVIAGAIYALMAAGLALVYGTMRMLNLAQGEFVMLGGFATWMLVVELDLPPWLAIPIAVCIVGAIAAAIQRGMVRPLMDRPGWEFSTIALTLGVSIILQNLAYHLWGERFQSVPYFIEGTLAIGGFRLPLQRLLILGVALASLAALAALLRWSRFGRAVRATAQDWEAAKVLGVDTAWVHLATFALAGGLGALAAALISPLTAVNPWMGVPLMLKAFVVVVLGGLGSFGGAIAGGLLLGVVEAVGVGLTASEWRDVISFTVLIAVIWCRPWGLFGQAPR